MTIFAQVADIGNYTINVCVELDNLENWQKKDGLWDPTDNSRKYDPDRPPSTLLYTSCFNMTVSVTQVVMAVQDFVVTEDLINSAPSLPVKPSDIAMYAGDELIVDYYAPFDGDGDDVAILVDLGRAASFATFDYFTRQLIIAEGATSEFTVGSYPIEFNMTDSAPADRGGPKTTQYNFILYIRFKPQDLTEGQSAS